MAVKCLTTTALDTPLNHRNFGDRGTSLLEMGVSGTAQVLGCDMGDDLHRKHTSQMHQIFSILHVVY
jgi:hypothetical protein